MNYKIIDILPLREGDTDNGHYRNLDFVVEAQQNVQYPDRYLLTLRGEKVNLLEGTKIGDEVTAEWSSNVRDYKTRDGRKAYSQQNICWKLENVTTF